MYALDGSVKPLIGGWYGRGQDRKQGDQFTNDGTILEEERQGRNCNSGRSECSQAI